jgi:hypothetical protein
VEKKRQSQPKVTVIGVGNKEPKIPAHDAPGNRNDLNAYFDAEHERRGTAHPETGPMEKTTIYLPAELRWYLKDAARRSGKSQADLIREALDAQRANAPRPKPKSIGAFRGDGGVSASEIKQWVRKEWSKDLEKKYPRRRAGA